MGAGKIDKAIDSFWTPCYPKNKFIGAQISAERDLRGENSKTKRQNPSGIYGAVMNGENLFWMTLKIYIDLRPKSLRKVFSVLPMFRLSKFCKEDPLGKPTPEIPPNPPLVKGDRGDFWRALPHGSLFWLRLRCVVASVALGWIIFLFLKMGELVVWKKIRF